MALGIFDKITFLGAQPHDVVAKELQAARAFVQNSLEATDGECEGTPVAILEAGACGLPVVATRHAGIPDVVIDGETGFLVEERDTTAMAARMVELADDPKLAARLGAAARERIATSFRMEGSLERLYRILAQAAGINRKLTPVAEANRVDGPRGRELVPS